MTKKQVPCPMQRVSPWAADKVHKEQDRIEKKGQKRPSFSAALDALLEKKGA